MWMNSIFKNQRSSQCISVCKYLLIGQRKASRLCFKPIILGDTWLIHTQFGQFCGENHIHTHAPTNQSINYVLSCRQKENIRLNYRHLTGLQCSHYFAIRLRYLLDYLPIDQWPIWNNQKTEQHHIFSYWIFPQTMCPSHHQLFSEGEFFGRFFASVLSCLIYFTYWCILSSYLNTTKVRLDYWYSLYVRVYFFYYSHEDIFTC